MDILTHDDIRKALGLPTVEVEKEIADKVEAVVETLKKRLQIDSIKAPTIDYELKGLTAGHATKEHVSFNTAFLYDERTKRDMIDNTVPHEVAHSVVDQVWPRSRDHGGEWQYLMLILGLKPERCHSYDTTGKKARNRQRMQRPFIYGCPCGEHKFTSIKHERAKNGTKYICQVCHTRVRLLRIEP